MCPSLELLSSFLDGELVESQIIKVEKHLQRCVECTRNLSEFQKITQALLEAKEPDINAAQSLVERRLELFSRNRSQILSFWTDLFKKANSVRVVSFLLSVVFVFGLWFLMFDDSELKNLVPFHFQSNGELIVEDNLTDSYGTKKNLVIQLPSESVLIQFSEPLILREDELVGY